MFLDFEWILTPFFIKKSSLGLPFLNGGSPTSITRKVVKIANCNYPLWKLTWNWWHSNLEQSPFDLNYLNRTGSLKDAISWTRKMSSAIPGATSIVSVTRLTQKCACLFRRDFDISQLEGHIYPGKYLILPGKWKTTSFSTRAKPRRVSSI